MALVDFCRLVDLYNLPRADACFLPIPSSPPPMSTTPPHSLAQPNHPPPETPKRSSSAACSVPKNTPSNHGSAARMKQEGDTDRVEGYKRCDYDNYIREDLNSRVFVDFEVFLKSVLHAPHDWRTLWGPTIEAVKADEKFIGHHKKYCDLCGKGTTVEKSFYTPLMETANAVIDVLSQSEFDGISRSPQHYHVNDPKRLRGGVMNRAHLSPDLVVLHGDRPAPEKRETKNSKANNTKPADTEPEYTDCEDTDCEDTNREDTNHEDVDHEDVDPEDVYPAGTKPKGMNPKGMKPSGRLHWANALHILEVKPSDSAICDGTTIRRLIVDGKHIPSFLSGGL